VRVAYADPPYPGQARRHYADHPDYAGEVDHAALLAELETYDGWCLHTSSPALRDLLPLCPADVRVMAWVKPFAAFKANVPVAYAWEPVLVQAARKPAVSERLVLRDYIAEPIATGQGLAGAKPDRVCRWLFEVLGLEPNDELVDLFPGTGAVTRSWDAWRRQLRLAI
jgi:hypothetical protein